MIRYTRSLFALLAVIALFFACSKKDDGVVTFKVDKATGTTGAYNGDKQIGTGSTTAVTGTAMNTTTSSTSSTGSTTAATTSSSTGSTTVFNIPCSPNTNWATFPDGKYPAENYTTSSDSKMGYYQMIGYGGQEQVQIMFHDPDPPTESKVYTTVDVPQSSDEVVVAFSSYSDNQNYWSNLGQSVYVSVDPNTHAVSITLCGLDLRSFQPSTGTYLHTHITGNFTR